MSSEDRRLRCRAETVKSGLWDCRSAACSAKTPRCSPSAKGLCLPCVETTRKFRSCHDEVKMILTGSQRIEANRETVWSALNDPSVLKGCIPGCTALDKVSDTEMRATSTLKVGPMKITFSGRVLFSDINPPHGYSIAGEGNG